MDGALELFALRSLSADPSARGRFACLGPPPTLGLHLAPAAADTGGSTGGGGWADVASKAWSAATGHRAAAGVTTASSSTAAEGPTLGLSSHACHFRFEGATGVAAKEARRRERESSGGSGSGSGGTGGGSAKLPVGRLWNRGTGAFVALVASGASVPYGALRGKPHTVGLRGGSSSGSGYESSLYGDAYGADPGVVQWAGGVKALGEVFALGPVTAADLKAAASVEAALLAADATEEARLIAQLTDLFAQRPPKGEEQAAVPRGNAPHAGADAAAFLAAFDDTVQPPDQALSASSSSSSAAAAAAWRPEKRVISFGLYGSNPKYVAGALANVALQRTYFPGWVCRFYVDGSVPLDKLAELRAAGAETVNMDGSGIVGGIAGMFWRFLIADDATVDRFIVRDSDSRLNARDALAVAEWCGSGQKVHTVRDHVNHERPLNGGMWGAARGFLDGAPALLAAQRAAEEALWAGGGGGGGFGGGWMGYAAGALGFSEGERRGGGGGFGDDYELALEAGYTRRRLLQGGSYGQGHGRSHGQGHSRDLNRGPGNHGHERSQQHGGSADDGAPAHALGGALGFGPGAGLDHALADDDDDDDDDDDGLGLRPKARPHAVVPGAARRGAAPGQQQRGASEGVGFASRASGKGAAGGGVGADDVRRGGGASQALIESPSASTAAALEAPAALAPVTMASLIGSYWNKDAYGADLSFLEQVVWPLVKGDALGHDAYSCSKFPGSVGFPSRRPRSFQHVGQVFDAEGRPRMTDIDGFIRGRETPKACRRNPEWIYG